MAAAEQDLFGILGFYEARHHGLDVTPEQGDDARRYPVFKGFGGDGLVASANIPKFDPLLFRGTNFPRILRGAILTLSLFFNEIRRHFRDF